MWCNQNDLFLFFMFSILIRLKKHTILIPMFFLFYILKRALLFSALYLCIACTHNYYNLLVSFIASIIISRKWYKSLIKFLVLLKICRHIFLMIFSWVIGMQLFAHSQFCHLFIGHYCSLGGRDIKTTLAMEGRNGPHTKFYHHNFPYHTPRHLNYTLGVQFINENPPKRLEKRIFVNFV